MAPVEPLDATRSGAPTTTVGVKGETMTDRLTGKAAQAALREENWQAIERAGGMLTDDEVAALPLATRDGLLGVVRPEGKRFPRFQIIDGASAPPAWLVLRDLLAPAEWSEENLLMWTLSPNAYLEGASPAQEIQAHPADVTPRLRYAVDRAIPFTKADWTGKDLAY